MTEVILVDSNDQPLGRMEKMEAHRQGKLHRAFSVFIFNSKGEMLLQQRALSKYHSAGLWTNACCSHPLPGEDTAVAAKRRLKEELGFETEIKKIFDFQYKTAFENGLTENEFDHVFTGEYEGPVPFNKEEVMDARFISPKVIAEQLGSGTGLYTAWFQLAFPRVQTWWEEHNEKGADKSV